MDLWDREIRPLQRSAESLSDAERFRRGVEAFDWTVRTMLGQIRIEEHRAIIQEVLGVARSAAARGSFFADTPEELIVRLEGAIRDGGEIGVGQLLMGLHEAYGGYDPWHLPTAMPSGNFMSILFNCYVFSKQRERDVGRNAEEQERNPRLSEVIAFQKELILRPESEFVPVADAAPEGQEKQEEQDAAPAQIAKSLWDEEIWRLEDRAERMSGASRLQVAVEAGVWVLRNVPDAFGVYTGLVGELMREAKAAVARGAEYMVASADLDDRLFDAIEESKQDEEPFELLEAFYQTFVYYFPTEGPERTVSADDLMQFLGDCFAAAEEHLAERAVAFQKRLILDAAP